MERTTGRRPVGDGGRVAVLVVKGGGGGGDRVLGHRLVHAVVVRPRVGPTGAFVTSLLLACLLACLLVACQQLANFKT